MADDAAKKTAKPRAPRKWYWRVARSIAAVLIGLTLLLWLMQERLLFHPADLGTTTPSQIGAAYETLSVATEDGETIHGWWIPYRNVSATSTAQGTVFFCHGNAGSIAHRLHFIPFFHHLRLNVVLWDYRGYGASTGSPSEAGMYRDAAAMWQAVQQRHQIPAASTIIYGRSLGGGVATWLALQDDFAGLVLDSSFTSASDRAQEIYPYLPVRWLLRHPFRSNERLAIDDEPTLFFHSSDDEIIPYHHATKNLTTVRQRVAHRGNWIAQLVTTHGGHNTGFHASAKTMNAALANFCAAVLSEPHRAATESQATPEKPSRTLP